MVQMYYATDSLLPRVEQQFGAVSCTQFLTEARHLISHGVRASSQMSRNALVADTRPDQRQDLRFSGRNLDAALSRLLLKVAA